MTDQHAMGQRPRPPSGDALARRSVITEPADATTDVREVEISRQVMVEA